MTPPRPQLEIYTCSTSLELGGYKHIRHVGPHGIKAILEFRPVGKRDRVETKIQFDAAHFLGFDVMYYCRNCVEQPIHLLGPF